MTLLEDAQRDAKLLKEHAYVRILTRDDPDAYCATTLLAHALRRSEIDFHVSYAPHLDEGRVARLAEDEDDCLVLIGFDAEVSARIPRSGAGNDAEASASARFQASGPGNDAEPSAEASATRTRITLPRSDHASISGAAQMIAVGLHPKNADLAPLAIAGALAARSAASHDARILEDAAASGVVRKSVTLNLHGTSLLTALSQTDEPYLPGITGRARNAKKLLTELGLSSDAPPEALSAQDSQRLGDALALRLLHERAPERALDALFRTSARALKGPNTGQDAHDLARLARAAAASGRGGLAFAALWGDEAAQRELGDLSLSLRDEMVAALLKAEHEIRREGPLSIADAPRSGACALFADRLALSFAPHGVAIGRFVDGDVATLASSSHRNEIAPAALAVGGHAASGVARVPALEESRFLKLLAEAMA